MHLRPEARRAALALDAPHVQPSAGARPRRRRRPAGPIENLANLKQHFPDSRTIIFPHIGHHFGIGGCLYQVLADFVDRGTTKGLDTTGCDGAVFVPTFGMPD